MTALKFLWPNLAIVAVLSTLSHCAMGQAAPVPESLSAPGGGAPPPVHYIAKEAYVEVPNGFPRGLDTVEVYADLPGAHPLALITHGTSDKEEDRERVTPWAQYGEALWFARRGYVALVVVRRGYGRSGGRRDGESGGCGLRGSFEEAGQESATDLRAVVQAVGKQPEINAGTVVSVGVSTGGFAQVALSADPPPHLKAAVSFAGGRGGDGKEHNCNLSSLVAAFRGFGKGAAKHGNIPMLWIYAQNDHWFPPAMAAQFDQAYRSTGGNDEFVMAPPDGEDGHHLFRHVEAWSATVSAFLQGKGLLPLGGEVLPPPKAPEVPAPAGLRDNGQDAWKKYLSDPPFKAFALAQTGEWGVASGRFDQLLADQDALEHCKRSAGANGKSCRIVGRTQ